MSSNLAPSSQMGTGPLPRSQLSILVTGVGGFIGSHLCERLLSDGHEVIGVDSFTDFYEPQLKRENLAALVDYSSFHLVEADLISVRLVPLLEGVDHVVHLAGQPGVRDSWGAGFDLHLRNNITATQRLLEAVGQHPVPFLFASSSSVYGSAEQLPTDEDGLLEPASPYGLTKLSGERLARLYGDAYGFPVTSLRYFSVYGPRQRPDMAFNRFLRAALSGSRISVFGDGQQSRDFTFVTDAVDATVRALETGARAVYNVGGGSLATINDALMMIEDILGCSITVDRWARVTGDADRTWADTSRIRADLAWCPRTSLEAGLKAQLDWVLGSPTLVGQARV